MLDGVKAGTLGEHPAGEEALLLARQLHLVNLDEGYGVRLLGRWPRVANARRHLQRAELDRVVHGDFEVLDAARHLVERGEHGDLVLDLGVGGGRCGREREAQRGHRQNEALSGTGYRERLGFVHTIAHRLIGLDYRSGAHPRQERVGQDWGIGVTGPIVRHFHALRMATNLSLTWSAVQTPRVSQSDGRNSAIASCTACVRSGSSN